MTAFLDELARVATANDREYRIFDSQSVTLQRVVDVNDGFYTGRVRVIEFGVKHALRSLRFEFDDELVFKQANRVVLTDFRVHRSIIRMFEQNGPWFSALAVHVKARSMWGIVTANYGYSKTTRIEMS